MQLDSQNVFSVSPQHETLYKAQQKSGTARRTCILFKLHDEVLKDELTTGLAAVLEHHEGCNIELLTSGRTVQQKLAEAQWTIDSAPLEGDTITQWHALNGHQHNMGLHIILLCHEQSVRYVGMMASAAMLDQSSLHLILQQALGGVDHQAMQYPDVASWLQEELYNQENREGRDYWQALVNRQHTVRLPTAQVTGFYSHSFDLERPVLEQLGKLAQCHGVSVSSLLETCWGLYWSMRLQQAQVTVHVGVSGRRFDELAGTLGVLDKFVPINVSIDDTQPVVALSRQVASTHNLNSEFIECFNPEEVQQGVAVNLIEVDGGSASVVYILPQENSFAATLNGYLSSQHAALSITSNCLTSNELALCAAHLQAMLSWLVENSDSQIAQLTIFSEQDQQFWQQKRNSQLHSSQQNQPQSLLKRVEHWVETSPHSIAVTDGDEPLSYAELYQRAMVLAANMQQCNVGRGDAILLYMGRSNWLPVSYLAAWLIGANVIPVSPDIPALRLQKVAAQSQARLIVATAENTTQLASLDEVALLNVNDMDNELTLQDTAKAGSKGIAYTIFTSGTSGEPKGVTINHLALSHYLESIESELALKAEYTYGYLSTVGADLGFTALFGSLYCGGTLTMIPEHLSLDADALASWLQKNPLDVLKIVPSHWETLFDICKAGALIPRVAMVFGGEALDYRVVNKVTNGNDQCQVYNHYGPSESTIGVIANKIDGANLPAKGMVPLGWALPHVDAVVVKDNLPVAAGFSGELFVSSESLSDGYLGNMALTESVFINWQGKRFYRTGDKVTVLEQGLLFRGRLDNQVKVRGHRVELEDIAQTLQQHSAVSRAIVRLDQQSQGLVAYWVGEQDKASLESWLKERLPEYMVPAQWVGLEEVPLTANGKVDFNRLPSPVSDMPANREPTTATEQQLFECYKALLNKDTIGIDDNFFQLGGNSLMATRLIARVKAQLAVGNIHVMDIFEYPTISKFAAYLEHKTVEQQVPGVQHRKVEYAPLTSSQLELYAAVAMEGGDQAYNVTGFLSFEGDLDKVLLTKCINRLIARHSALRTTFTYREDQIVQLIHDSLSIEVSTMEVTDKVELDRLIQAEGRSSFDLENGPLIRARLLEANTQQSYLLISIHHIVVDGWSVSILIDELCKLYNSNADDVCLAETLQLSDFSLWQQDWLTSEPFEQALQLRVDDFTNWPEPLNLPYLGEGKQAQQFVGARHDFRLPEKTTQQLKLLGEKYGATDYMVLMTLFSIALSRYFGQAQICMTSPIAGREMEELGSVVGNLLNSILFCHQMEQDASFVELLERVKQETLKAYNTQSVPLEQLVQRLEDKFDATHLLQQQVRFVYRNQPEAQWQLPGVKAAFIPQDYGIAKFNLMLIAEESNGQFSGCFEYNTARFSKHAISQLCDLLVHSCNYLCEQPEQALQTFTQWQLVADMLTGTSISTDNVKQSDTVFSPVHREFEHFADTTPQQTALWFDGEQYSYGDVERRANGLANELINAGVSKSTPVAIKLVRSPDLMVAQLAVLKAGGCFLVIDEQWPVSRVQTILTQQVYFAIGECPQALAHLEVTWVDNCKTYQNAQRPALTINANDLAYIIFTSGTTGVPKGVMVSHGNIKHYVDEMAARVAIKAGDTFAATSTLAADLAYTALFGALTSGGCFAYFSQQTTLNDQAMADFMGQLTVSHAKFTPSYFETLFQLHGTKVLPQKALLLGGEAINPSMVNELLAKELCRVFNHYGPSEATVGCLIHECQAGDNAIPLGKPFNNSHVMVLDGQQRPCFTGIPGEIYVSGNGVSPGHWQQDGMTSEQFVELQLFGGGPLRFYRTGDLGHSDKSGNIHFLGRIDDQVKIRGYRVEINEIEQVIQGCDAVGQCVVLPEQDGSAIRLTAYLTLSNEELDSIKQKATDTLPEYMQPANWQVVEQIPLTINGKVDRNKLAKLKAQLESSQVAPRDEVEAAIHRIWANLLERESLGVSTGFISSGGDSITAIKVIAKMRGAGLNATLVDLLDNRSIAEMAARQNPQQAAIEQAIIDALSVKYNGELNRHTKLTAAGVDSIEAVKLAAKLRKQGVTITVSDVLTLATPANIAQAAIKNREQVIEQSEAENAYADMSLSQLPDSVIKQFTFDVQDSYPATPLQAGMLFETINQPHLELYHNHLTVEFSKGFDLCSLNAALAQLLERHSILRTQFYWDQTLAPQQVVRRRFEVPVHSSERNEVSRENALNAFQELLQKDKESWFNLENCPPIRLVVQQYQDDKAFIALSYHHILLDGWSLALIVNELWEIYTQQQSAREPTDFGAYVSWLNEQSQDKANAFWAQTLSAVSHSTPLPLRSEHQETGTGRVSWQPDNKWAGQINALAQRLSVTPSVIYQAAWAIVLSRLSGEATSCFGLTVSGRPAELEQATELVGMMINTVPQVAEFVPGQSVEHFMQQVALQSTRVQEFGYLSLTEIKKQSVFAQQSPLFESAMVFENQAQRNLSTNETVSLNSVDELQGQGAGTGMPLTWVIHPGTGYKLELLYASQYFSDANAEHLLGMLQAVLTNLVNAESNAQLSSIGLMEQAKAERYLQSQQPELAVDYRTDDSLIARLEEVAQTFPTRVAVSDGSDELTYQQLWKLIQQRAGQLATAGISQGQRIGIMQEWDNQLIINIAAALMLGAAYVPIEPSAPKQRIKYICEDAQLDVIVIANDIIDKLPQSTRCITISELNEYETQQVQHCLAAPHSPAYMIYTSGTTGKPKGVPVTHSNVMSLFDGCDKRFTFSECDIWTLFHSYAFDFSVWEIWGALLHGAQLVVVPYWVSRDTEAFHGLLQEKSVTVLSQTPSAFALLNAVDEKSDRRVSSLRYVVFGGEALERYNVASWSERNPQSPDFINMYGITETTVHVSFHQVDINATEQDNQVPIGSALPHLGVVVTDFYGAPLPPYVPGEMRVFGAGVTGQYWKRPQLSGEKFVADPLTGLCYRSGDLAWYDESGVLNYGGRYDEQVKLRGFRIELGEIENQLLAMQQVNQACVVVTQSASGQQQLAAYLSLTSPTSVESITAGLQNSLPHYMVPTAFTVLDELPLTMNGKIDKAALKQLNIEPVSCEAKPIQKAAEQQPENKTQTDVLAVWKSALKLDVVAKDDNFFSLGGDSILSLQVVSGLRNMGYQLSPRDLFEHPSVEKLAAKLELADLQVPVEAGADVSVNTALHPIQHWFFEQGLPSQSHWNQAQLFAVNGELDRVALGNAVAMLSAQHPVLHSRFSQLEGEWVSEVGGRTDAVLVSHEGGVSESQWEVVSSGYQAGLDISQGDNWRVVLLADEQGQTYVLILVHHLIIDGVSWRILLEDLWQCYEGARKGEQVSLTSTAPYSQWSGWLASQTAAFAHERDYWAGHEHGFTLNGQTNDSRNSYGAQAQVKATLDKVQTKVLLERLPMSQRAQINEVMVSALVDVLCQWQGTTQCSVMLEGHGRDSEFGGPDVSRSLGWFTSLYPQHFALQGADIGARLRHVRAQLKRVPQGGLGYGVLRYLGKDSQLQGTELAVSFNYLGQFDQALSGQTLLQPALLSSGLQRAAQGQRAHLLDINALVVGGELHITWHYSPAHLPGEQVKAQLAAYVARLQAYLELATQACMTTSGVDYPLLRLSDEAINRLGERYSWEGVSEAYPLSPLQEGLLFHERLSEGGQLYFNQLSGRLDGLSDVAKFKAAWQAVVKEQDILRSRFIWEGVGEPLQQVVRDVEVNWEEADWRGLNSEVQQAQLEAYLAADKTKGFALDAAPLMRFGLFRVGEARYELVWSRHHLLLDGWCTGLLLQDVLGRYEQGDAYQGPLRRPYKDYIAWLQKQDSGLDYWQETLAGVSGATALPVEATGAQGYGLVSEVLSQGQSEQLRAVAAGYGVTLNTLFQGAWARLLQQYSGDADVVFGVTVSGRPLGLAGAEQMVGLFINSLPLRVKQDAGELGSWLQQIQGSNLAMREYEHCSLAAIQQACGLGANETLFNSLMVFENYPEGDRRTELTFERGGGHDITNYPVTVKVALRNGEYVVELSYQKHHFSGAVINNIMRGLITLLGNLSNCENVNHWQLLSESQKQEQLTQWSGRTSAAVPEHSLAYYVEQQVQQQPSAIAVTGTGGELTYQQLNQQANRLAHKLVQLGVARGDRVGFVTRSTQQAAIVMLGIVKLGAVYVPLDPSYPQERLALMVQDATPSVLIGDESTTLDWAGDIPVITLVECEDCSTNNPGIEVDAGQLAYICYTSGTTGRPKGVMVPHRAVVTLVKDTNYVHLNSDSRIAQLSNLSFDAATFEFWGAMLNGATMVEVNRSQLLDATNLKAVFEQFAVSEAFITVSLFRFLAFEEPSMFNHLATLIVGGEALDLAASRKVMNAGGPSRLLNGYGPTENTTFTTWYQLQNQVTELTTIPIGRPLNHREAYLLDEQHNIVPVGRVAELYVGGAGIATGYWKQALLTAEKFIDHPFSPGEKLYRTGDLCRFNKLGEIIYLGRADNQVKLRGFRIELNEIEAVISQSESVQHALVTVIKNNQVEDALVAYIVGDESAEAAIRAHVKLHLPEYMVPASLVFIEQIPLTANGKADLGALPQPEISGTVRCFEEPVSKTEQLLAEIWGEFIQVERIGRNDDFFELGGNSLLLARVNGRISAELSINVSIGKLFELSVLKELSDYLTQLQLLLLDNESVENDGELII